MVVRRDQGRACVFYDVCDDGLALGGGGPGKVHDGTLGAGAGDLAWCGDGGHDNVRWDGEGARSKSESLRVVAWERAVSIASGLRVVRLGGGGPRHVFAVMFPMPMN